MNNWEKQQAESRARRQAIEDAKKALEPSRWEKVWEKVVEPVSTVIGAVFGVVAVVVIVAMAVLGLYFGRGLLGWI